MDIPCGLSQSLYVYCDNFLNIGKTLSMISHNFIWFDPQTAYSEWFEASMFLINITSKKVDSESSLRSNFSPSLSVELNIIPRWNVKME